MTSTNTVVANAMAARTARNAYCEAGDYIETRDGGQETVERVVGDKVYLKSGDVIRMSDVKAVLNASRVARNARTDWEQEIYKLTERIKALVQKSQRENGDDYPTTVFKDALKAMRGY